MPRRPSGLRGVPPYVEWPPKRRVASRKKLESVSCPHCRREFDLPAFRPGIRRSAEACDKVRELTRGRTQESFLALFLDTRNRVAGMKEICRGTAGSCVVHPRDIFREAALHNASGVILAHNHPSGFVAASDDDVGLTRRMVQAGRVLDIPVLDHVIVGETGCYSLREGGKVVF